MALGIFGPNITAECIKKPDIVAPGSDIISCNALRNYSRYIGMKDIEDQEMGRSNLFRSPMRPRFNSRGERYNIMYTSKSGTSMATPIVTGAIALLLSQNPGLTNREVKMKLRESTTDLGYSWSKQGCGLLNVEKLLQ
jgi:serine protease AprX